MTYKRKTRHYWEVQANYGYGDDWETLFASIDRKECLNILKDYRENAPRVLYRIKKFREKID